jgi:hypothetical protein
MPIFKTNKGEDINFKFGGWADLTLNQYVRMRLEWDGKTDNPKSMLAFLSIVTGMTFKEVENDKSKGLKQVASYLAKFVKTPLQWDQLPIPPDLGYNGRLIPVTNDLAVETFGQKAAISSLMQQPENVYSFERDGEQFEDYPKLYGWIVAIYMQPYIDAEKDENGDWKKAPFDTDRAEEIKDELMQRKAIDIVPIALFFCAKFLKSSKSGILSWLLQAIQNMRCYVRQQILPGSMGGVSIYG